MALLMILLTILKTLGLVLLCILLLILTVLALVLFVPVRYELKGQKSGDDIEAHVAVTWLLKFLNAKVDIFKPGEEDLRTDILVKVLFFKVFPRKEDGEKGGRKKKQTPDKGAKKPSPDRDPQHRLSGGTGDGALPDKESTFKGRESTLTDKEEDKPGFFEKLRRTREKLKALPGKIRDKFRELRDKWFDLRDNVTDKKQWLNDKLEIINSPQIREALPKIIDTVKALFIHISPKKGSLHVDMGREDPADTGKIVAIYSAALPLVGRWLYLNAYFEEERLDAHGDLAGRIRLFTILRLGLSLWFDKKFKRAFSYIRRRGLL